jgi:lapA secretion ATP-binding protein
LGLSGGQKQIIALARMTLRDPKVVLLDEPTTSLDQGTERMALNAIAQWGRNRTMLLVTHRPQVLQIVNRIIVMENGKVVMDGPRDLVLQKLMQNEQNKVKAAQQAQENQRPGEAAQA